MRILSDREAQAVAGAKIRQVNAGGNEPRGEANGIPSTNPTGKAPAGQNK